MVTNQKWARAARSTVHHVAGEDTERCFRLEVKAQLTHPAEEEALLVADPHQQRQDVT